MVLWLIVARYFKRTENEDLTEQVLFIHGIKCTFNLHFNLIHILERIYII